MRDEPAAPLTAREALSGQAADGSARLAAATADPHLPLSSVLARARRRRLHGRLVTEEILVLDGFLSRDTCARVLTELDGALWQPSPTYKKQADGSYRNVVTDFRTSETAHQEWFSAPLKSALAQVERRLGALFDVTAPALEAWQATRYRHRGKFDYHLDAGYWEGHYAGDRILTFLLYLDTPRRGGGTHFRALDVHIEARAGRLLVWHNLFPNGGCDHRMIHSSTPLLAGHKTTLVTWQRQKRYRSSRDLLGRERQRTWL
jgi:prolyl 4-hydroxylase